MCSVKYSETGLLCVAQGLFDHVDCGFTDKFNNYDVHEQCVVKGGIPSSRRYLPTYLSSVLL